MKRLVPPHSLSRTLITAMTMLIAAAALVAAPTAPADAAPADRAKEPSAAKHQKVATPTLTARATLSADYLAPGPRSGRKVTPANGRTGPFDGQVIPGFSAALANGDGTFWAMPDNGFGAKDNSEDFLLRLYLVKPRWERADSGSGAIQVLRYITLSDPKHRLPFPIVNERSTARTLTGGDFDIESVQRMADGSFWIGDEFGPFPLHVDRAGRVLSAPISSPLGRSPQHPQPGERAPKTQASGGFEAMAKSPDGRYLYPILEKSRVGDPDPRRRLIAQFDTRTQKYTGRTWNYRVDTDANLVADAQFVGRDQLLVLERDDFDGPASVTKRAYTVKLGAPSTRPLAKKLHVDLLKIANPAEIGAGDGWGTGSEFAFGFQSVETIVPLSDGRLMVANDNNYPGNSARRPGTPDDTEMIIIDPTVRTTVTTPAALVVAHRGASGYRPEHTLAAYALAIRQCAAFIEPDVVMTSDGVAVVRHENEIGGTTDVAKHPEFADRRTTKIIDGVSLTGWFTEDFTLAELRTLRAVERLAELRTANTAYDGRYPIPTLTEVLDLARHSRTCTGAPVGVAPETKHPSYFASIGLPLERPIVAALTAAGLNRRSAPVIIQSFEVGNLKRLNRLTDVALEQLVNCSGAPWDLTVAGDDRTYADLVTRAGLKAMSRYADVVGFCKDVMIPRTSDGSLGQPTSVITEAHRAGLTVIGWTFRAENSFLPREFRDGADPATYGDLAGEIQVFLEAGMDGFFTDQPDLGVRALTRHR